MTELPALILTLMELWQTLSGMVMTAFAALLKLSWVGLDCSAVRRCWQLPAVRSESDFT